MSPIEQLLMSPTWKHRKEELDLSPFKKKDYDGLSRRKAKSIRNRK